MPARPPLSDRQRGEQQRCDAAIREQQQHDESDRADRTDAVRFGARLRVDQHREIAGAADHEARGAGVCQRVERMFERGDRGALRRRIEARATGLGKQQRGAVGREPDSVAQRGRMRRRPALGQGQRFQGRIAREQRLEQAGRGRGEVLEPLLELLVQIRGVERVVIEGRRQQVAVRQQCVVERGRIECAVDDLLEMRVVAAAPPRGRG